MKRWISLIFILLLTGCAGTDMAKNQPVDPYLSPVVDAEVGRTYSQQIMQGDAETLWAQFSPEFQSSMSEEDLQAFLTGSVAPLGAEKQVLYELAMPISGGVLYERVVQLEKFADPMTIQLGLTPEGKVGSLLIQPAAKAAFAPRSDDALKTKLRLPFDGEWTVLWGGRSVWQNYHAIDTGQRYAFDFLVQRDGTSFNGDGTKNEDYYCFGQPVMAPAAGKISKVVDGIADNIPGQMNPDQAEGNYLIIDHGNHEITTLAHFQQNTITVEKGDTVEAGQVLGLCGNSGNSSEAHIHMHMQSTALPWIGFGLPAVFEDYLADGQPQSHAMPVRGQVISPQ